MKISPLIQHIFSPLSPDDFFGRYWDQNFVHVEGRQNDWYDDILTLDDVDKFMARNDVKFPSIRVAKDGLIMPLSKYTNIATAPNPSAPLIDPDKLFDCFCAGATIVMQMMRFSIPSLSAMVNELEHLLGFRIETNVYLTPSNARGFSAHYDDHNVLVMQIHGSKTWRLFDSVRALPIPGETIEKIDYKSLPLLHEITLQPGDLLYIPRGMVHEAVTCQDTSVHITVALFSHLWINVFRTGLVELENESAFLRCPFPASGSELYEQEYIAMVDKYLSGLNHQRIIAKLTEPFNNKTK